jgi:glucuronyl/N-acetylglucosaminyl transferase EXT1
MGILFLKNVFTNQSMESLICLQIVRERLPSQPSRDGLVWNSSPGALLTLPHFSDTLRHYPFYLDVLGVEPDNKFTAVIYSQLGGPAVSTSPLYRLIRNVARSQYVARVSTEL